MNYTSGLPCTDFFSSIEPQFDCSSLDCDECSFPQDYQSIIIELSKLNNNINHATLLRVPSSFFLGLTPFHRYDLKFKPHTDNDSNEVFCLMLLQSRSATNPNPIMENHFGSRYIFLFDKEDDLYQANPIQLIREHTPCQLTPQSVQYNGIT